MEDENAAGAIAGTAYLVGNAINAYSQERTNKWQMKLAQYAYDQERQMVREQNAYNSPLNQLKRYEEAGLNPNLIYGEGKASAGNQSSIAQYKAPDLKAPQIGSLGVAEAIKTTMDVALLQAQLKKIDNEAYAADMQGRKLEQESYSGWLKNMFDSVIMGITPGVIHLPEEVSQIQSSLKFRGYDANVNSIETGISLKNAQTHLIDANEKLSRLSLKAQQYYYDNIQPLVTEIMQKKSIGIGIQNDLLNLQKEFFKADKWFHYGESLLRDIISGINAFKPYSFGSPSGGSLSPSWYGSPMYPNESYTPGL